MRLNGWTWLVSGLILTIMSGYVYLTIPKNGQPNMAMAFFFFVGVVFLVIGITQLFFKRRDDQSVLNSITKEPQEQKIVTMPNIATNQNKVEVAIEQMLQQRTQEVQPQVKQNVQPPMQTPAQAPVTHQAKFTNEIHKATQHTNSFAHLHQYKGPVHTPSTGAHAQHPVSQHVQQQSKTHQASAIHNTTQHQSSVHNTQHPATTHHPIQNTTEHSLKCGKCSNVNPGHSNYCHKCGARLK